MDRRFFLIKLVRWSDLLVELGLLLLQSYLTDVWKLSFTHAAAILNVWSGISKILPNLFLFFVDAFWGNFMTLVLSSVAYSLGIGLISLSLPPILADSTGTCKQYEPSCIGLTQKYLFYIGMALVAIGTSGHLVSLDPFLKEQESTTLEDYKPQKVWLRLLKQVMLGLVIPIFGTYVIPFIKLWWIGFGIPAICSVVATLLFLSGWCTYDKDTPNGSPVTTLCRVVVAFASNIFKPFPDRLYKDYDGQDFMLLRRTRFLRCLEKAAIDTKPEIEVKNRWKLCSVAEVEEAKFIIRMLPMLMTFKICGIVSSIGNTYFVEQASHMNRKIGKHNVPLVMILFLLMWTKSLTHILARNFLRFVKSKRLTPLLGIALAMVFSVLCCITAASVETRRLNVIRIHGLIDKPDEEIPMSVFWLLFQFFLLAGLDSFFEKSVAAFYENEVPERIRAYFDYLTKGMIGLGYICGVFSVNVVGKISERGGQPNWFQFTLNGSRLDRYYWVLAALSSVNLVIFILMACNHSRTNEYDEDAEVDGCHSPF